MTKKMFSQLLEKNCGKARGGNLNYTCLPGTKCLDYHIYHIMLWTPEIGHMSEMFVIFLEGL